MGQLKVTANVVVLIGIYILSKVSENVRPSVQRKCHSVMPRWYQMMA